MSHMLELDSEYTVRGNAFDQHNHLSWSAWDSPGAHLWPQCNCYLYLILTLKTI